MAAGPCDDGPVHLDGDVDARVLGRLFSSMLLLEALPTTEQVAEFLEAVLCDIPGVTSCRIRLEGAGSSSSAAGLDGAATQWVIPVETGARAYGAFLLEVEDDRAVAPYRPFFANLAISVAVLTENRWRRAQLEAALEEVRESEQRFATMFEQAPLGIALIDSLTGRFLDVNPRFAKLTGRRREKLVATDWMSITYPDDAPVGLKSIARMNAGETAGFKQSVRYVRPDGSIVWVDMTASPVRFEDASLLRHLCMAEDITDRRAAEEARREAERELSALNLQLEQRVQARTAELVSTNIELESFAYSISHDLRSPLRAIDGFSQIIMDDYADVLDEAGRHSLERVRAAAQKMGLLMDDLLALSRLNRKEMQFTDVDLSRLAADIVGRLREEDPERLVEVTVDAGCSVRGDAGLLEILLANLIGNAWKFTSSRETASISFGEVAGDGERVFVVSDDGAGFDSAYADKLFVPFERLHGPSEFPGTGIGLATVQRICARHGGRCWAEGAVGEGARLFFTLGALTG